MSDSGPAPSEAELSEFLRDLGANLVALGWPVEEVDRAVSYVRKAHERGERFGDALVTMWNLHKAGRFRSKETD